MQHENLNILDVLNWQVAKDFGWEQDPAWMHLLEENKANPLAQWMQAIMQGNEEAISRSSRQSMTDLPVARQWQLKMVQELLTGIN